MDHTRTVLSDEDNRVLKIRYQGMPVGWVNNVFRVRMPQIVKGSARPWKGHSIITFAAPTLVSLRQDEIPTGLTIHSLTGIFPATLYGGLADESRNHISRSKTNLLNFLICDRGLAQVPLFGSGVPSKLSDQVPDSPPS